mgnify:CR=1 FL=1
MPPSTNKPVLITGAATPLGHEVCRTLLAAGREVVALIDTFISTPFPGEERHARRIAQLAEFETTGAIAGHEIS